MKNFLLFFKKAPDIARFFLFCGIVALLLPGVLNLLFMVIHWSIKDFHWTISPGHYIAYNFPTDVTLLFIGYAIARLKKWKIHQQGSSTLLRAKFVLPINKQKKTLHLTLSRSLLA